MNRIRKVNNIYQVLITPDIKISPDSSLLLGNWEDENLRNFYVLEFESLNDAQCEAFNWPDIDWYRIVMNHEQIYKRLEYTLRAILDTSGFNVEFKPNLMDPDTFKNTIFDRVLNNGERFNLRYGATDLISFTIVNPWSNNLHNISRLIENYRSHLFRDDLRIRNKEILDGKMICLYGVTELSSIYEIRLVPTLIYHFTEWYKKSSNNGKEKNADNLYKKILKQQDDLDRNVVIR